MRRSQFLFALALEPGQGHHCFIPLGTGGSRIGRDGRSEVSAVSVSPARHELQQQLADLGVFDATPHAANDGSKALPRQPGDLYARQLQAPPLPFAMYLDEAAQHGLTLVGFQ